MAPRSTSRTTRHGRGTLVELVALAAQIAGCSQSMVYKVLERKVRSARVMRAIDAAKGQLKAAA